MQEIREIVGPTIGLSLSLGKDSIASLILCNEVFDNIYCLFGEQLPTRSCDVKYANYLRKFFPKVKCINFYPHRVFVDYISNGIYRKHSDLKDPFFLNGGETDEDVYSLSYEDMANNMFLEYGIDPSDKYQAVGVKMSDSLNRRMALSRTGYINFKNRTFFPIRDFSTENVYEIIRLKGIKLHPDYLIYGSTFEGMAAKYWVNAYRKDPETWSLIKAYFPMAEAYVFRDLFKRRQNGQATEN